MTIGCWFQSRVVPGGAHFRVATRLGFLAIAPVLLMVPEVQVCRLQLRASLAELQIEPVPFSLDLEGGRKWLGNQESMFVGFGRNLSPN